MYFEQSEDERESMRSRRIKFVIDSDLENVFLISMTIRNLCSLVSLSDMEIDQVELCLVEAVNNSIEHAYGKQKGHNVEVVVYLSRERLMIEVCDMGKAMDESRLEGIDPSFRNMDLDDLDSIPEEGRGLPIIKTIMDSVFYKVQNGRNCFTMIKSIRQKV